MDGTEQKNDELGGINYHLERAERMADMGIWSVALYHAAEAVMTGAL